MEFFELSEFTKIITAIATDEEYIRLQMELCKAPDKGSLVKGTGGARKIRMSIGSKGKSGGARAIYYWKDEDDVIWLLKAYLKKNKADLTESEKHELYFIISDIKRGLL